MKSLLLLEEAFKNVNTKSFFSQKGNDRLRRLSFFNVRKSLIPLIDIKNSLIFRLYKETLEWNKLN